jgi:hypothetical protein
MQIQKTLTKIPFLRNIVGAIVGAFLAMSLYGAYQMSTQMMAAILPSTPIEDTRAEDAARTERVLKVGALAKEILESEDSHSGDQVH